jgi:hypothetical protein
MSFPFAYDHGAPLVYGGALRVARSFDDSKVVILPVPLDRTTSYVAGTRNGPHEILQASSHMELWDEEIAADVHPIGIFTLPEMELPFGEMAPLMDEIQRVASEILSRDKFLVTLGHPASRRRLRRALPGPVGPPDRRARGSPRHLHGDAPQPRLRHAPEPRARARDASRHSQHVHRRSRRRRLAEHHGVL